MRVIVADDSFLARRGIIAVLTDAGHEVVAEAGDADKARAAVAELAPDLAVLDIRMPPTHTDEGLAAAAAVRDRHPATAVLVLSHYLEPDYAMALLSASPQRTGYLLKDRIVEETPFLRAVDRVGAGECVVDPDIVSLLMARRRRWNPIDTLTGREREVLSLVAEGYSNAAIGARLAIAERTVESHATQIFMKLGIDDAAHSNRRVLAVLAYLRTTE